MKKRVHVITLGGTIAMTDDSGEGVHPTLSAEELLGTVEHAPDLEVTTESVMTIPGAHLTVEDIIHVQSRASDALQGGATGVVVVQGTDTLEETAFVSDLLHSGPATIVFTGAMRPPGALGADGPANLRDAIIAAATIRSVGVLVCMGAELHSAQYVAKTHAFRPAAFTSPQAGPVGWVVENLATVHYRPHRTSSFRMEEIRQEVRDPYVPVFRISLGDRGRALDAIASSGPDGLVLEAFGVGHASPAVADVAGRLASIVPVVLASRTGNGSVLRSTYGFEGSERDLLARGLISAGALNGLKARLLLTLALRAKNTPEMIRERFAPRTEPNI